MRPRVLSPLPVRPLRLSPITATAGGRALLPRAIGAYQLAAVTPTDHGPVPEPVPFSCAPA